MHGWQQYIYSDLAGQKTWDLVHVDRFYASCEIKPSQVGRRHSRDVRDARFADAGGIP
jgi:hypothetical protein